MRDQSTAASNAAQHLNKEFAFPSSSPQETYESDSHPENTKRTYENMIIITLARPWKRMLSGLSLHLTLKQSILGLANQG